jgi:4-amino-4-deoxy-L-arabinose transferase-like glycosyltransferase
MFHWMTGTTVIGSSLLVGQILNAAAVPLAYLLTERMGGGRSAGLWAAILVGCVSLMPGYYLNWGRYTQLAGQTALVAVCVCWAALLEQDRRDWRLAALCGVLSGCLAITHYRVAAFAGCFVAAYGIWAMAMSALPLRRRLGLALTHAAVAAALALLLTLSWWLNIASGYLIDGALLFLRPTAEQAAMAATHNAWGAITPFYVKPYVLLGSFIGLLAAAWQRQWRLLALALWAGIVLLITNPAAVGLGGGGIITNFAVFIAAYIVVLPLCGYAIAVALGLLPALARTPLTALAALALLGWSVGWQSDIADRQFQLLGPEDAAAMAWVRDHTPPDARFLIDSAVAYSGSSAIGIDGGLWLPLAAQRTTTLPPLTYTSERAERPTYAWEVLPFIQNLRDQGLGSSASLAALRADGVGYVYLGPHRNPDYQGWIDLAQLQGSPAWQQVYNRDGVQIFQLNAGR